MVGSPGVLLFRCKQAAASVHVSRLCFLERQESKQLKAPPTWGRVVTAEAAHDAARLLAARIVVYQTAVGRMFTMDLQPPLEMTTRPTFGRGESGESQYILVISLQLAEMHDRGWVSDEGHNQTGFHFYCRQRMRWSALIPSCIAVPPFIETTCHGEARGCSRYRLKNNSSAVYEVPAFLTKQ
jgi:hypothetical protein